MEQFLMIDAAVIVSVFILFGLISGKNAYDKKHQDQK